MADNVVGIRFGVAGGSSISGESGQLIKSQLEELSKQIHLKVNIDKNHFTQQLTSLKAELEKTLGDLKITIKTDNVTATQGNGGTSSGGAGGSSANAQASAYDNLRRQLEALSIAQQRQIKNDAEGGVTATIAEQKIRDLTAAYSGNRREALANGNITKEQADSLDQYAQSLDRALQMEQKRASNTDATSKLEMSYAKLQRNAQSLYTDGGFDKVIARSKEARQIVDDFNAKVNSAFTDDMSIEDKQAAVKKLNQEFIGTQSQLKKIQRETDTLGNKLKDTFTSKILQTFAYAIIGIATRALKQLYQNVVELDRAITDLQIASGKTREETEELIKAYSKLAKQLGATTLEVAQSADTWLRQGYSIEEANTLIYASMMLSKLGQIESAEASKALTSAMKGYKKEVEEATDIVDKFTAVDMEAAVSAGDIATAMAETATSADIAGVSMNKLIGYIATVAEVTQDGAESVGTFYKTLFARMNQVAAGNFIDEETGESLNDVETVLNELGIALRDTNGIFRSSGDVLDEVASKWENFDNVEQHAIATAFAGTRQQEKFIVLMENYGDALDYAATAADSAGTAQEKYTEAYVESIDAALNRLTTSWEKFSMTVLDSSLVIGLVDLLSGIVDLLSGIASIADGMLITIPAIVVALYALYAIILKIKATAVFTTMWTGLKSVLAIFPALIAGFNAIILKLKAQAIGHKMTTAALNAQAASTQAATAAQQAFNATNPVGWIILAVTAIYALVKAFGALADSKKAAIERYEKEAEEQDALVEKYDTEIEALTDLQKKLEEAHGNKRKLASIYDDLNKKVSVSTKLLNGEEAAYIAVNQQIQDQIKYQEEARKAANDAAIAAKRASFNDRTMTRYGDILHDWLGLTSSAVFMWDWAGSDATGEQMRQLMRGTHSSFGNDVNYKVFYEEWTSDQQDQWMRQYGFKREDWEAYWNNQVSIAKEVFSDTIANADGYFGQEFLSNAVEQLVMNGLNLDEINSVIEGLLTADGQLETMLSEYYLSLANESADSAALYDQLQAKLNELKTAYPELAALIDALSKSISTNITVVDKSVIKYKTLLELIEEVEGEFDTLNSALKEINDTGVVALDTIEKILEDYPDLERYFTKTNQGYVMNDAYSGWSMNDVLNDYATGYLQQYVDKVHNLGLAGEDTTKAQEELNNAIAVMATLLRTSAIAEATEAYEKQRDEIEEQLDRYKELIDIRKDLLKTYKEEVDYQKELEKKQRNIASLRTQISLLKLDNSESGKARARELEEELSEAQDELDDFTLEHAIDLLIDDLDSQYSEYETLIEREVDRITAAIDGLAASLNVTPVVPAPTEQHHTGGFAGGMATLKDNEIFAKLLNGEFVSTPAQMSKFLRDTYPKMLGMAQGGNGGIQYNAPIVAIRCDSVTEDTMPTLKKVVKQAVDEVKKEIDSAFSRTGYRREVNKFSI